MSLSKEDVCAAVEQYYKEHLATGLEIDVTVSDLAEDQASITVAFLEQVGDGRETVELTVPIRDGVLDWTAAAMDGDQPHKACPEQDSSPKQDLKLPAKQKPKKEPERDEEGHYIQQPKKVGSVVGAIKPKESAADRRNARRTKLGENDPSDGWPTSEELARDEVGTRSGGDPDDWVAASESGIPGEQVQEDHAAFALEEAMMKESQPIVALLEYTGHEAVKQGPTVLYEFRLIFATADERDAAAEALKSQDEVLTCEPVEEVGLSVALGSDQSQDLAEDQDAAGVLQTILTEVAEVAAEWEDGHQARYLKEWNDNKGAYHKGVQTQANEPKQPKPNDGADAPSGEQGGDKQGHSGVKKQGGTGVGKTQKVTQQKKLRGSKAEALTEQPNLDDLVSFGEPDKDEKPGDTEPDAELPGEPEADAEFPGEPEELDPVIRELVQAQAANGLETVMQVAKAKYDEDGKDWSDEAEQTIRDEYARVAGESEEADTDLELDVEIGGEGEGEEPGEEEPVGLPAYAEAQEPDEWITVEEMEQLCPGCAAQMREKGVTRVREDQIVYDGESFGDGLEEADRDDARKQTLEFLREQGDEEAAVDLEEKWDKKIDIKKGQFTAWCKRRGFEGGPGLESARRAFASKDASTRGMATFYMNTVKPGGKTASALKTEESLSLDELCNRYGVKLDDAARATLADARFDAAKVAQRFGDAKEGLGEALQQLVSRVLGESAQNPNVTGGKQTWKRVRGKNKAASPFGWVKPNMKFKGLIRIVWDDGHESWEKSGDIQAVSNPRNLKSPAGGAAKPAGGKPKQQGGVELATLKGLESVRKRPTLAERFLRVIELRLEGVSLPDDKVAELLTEGVEEFDDPALLADLIQEPVEEQPVEEEQAEEQDELKMRIEDFGLEDEVVTITDDELDS